ncbi:DUF2971 domain-containing protein [Methylophilus sp. YYY-1]|uniref:DUF2971 domain-containing protein n=1 Tax=Methylophilus sp. YYY-1 TaxID=2682087 RepID=UPI0023B31635|nr:DUF2971 domain-containing protein [Methylophilus sp. YYY-1]MDF0378469.1 DUF2971 domain-containing protein [Methylophilus sp. YYY-1]
MRAYYLTSEKWALEAIKKRRLKLSRLDEMNDPFELLGVSLKTKESRSVFLQLKKELNEEIGILCFSKTWHNPVMWSHYGNRHKGLCLGFDLMDDWTFPISYKGVRLKEDTEKGVRENKETLGHQLLTTKYKHWEYEREVRMIIQLKHAVKDKEYYFLPFCNALNLREVIIGARNDTRPEKVSSNISTEDFKVKITKSRMAFGSFKIVMNKAFKVVESGTS